MKVAVPLAKNILTPLGIIAATSAIDVKIQKSTCFRDNNFNNLKWKNKWDNKNCSSSRRF